MTAETTKTGVAADVIETIGETPLVYLERMGAGLGGKVAVKLESRNPAGSVKDRIGLSMVEDAERRGTISAGRTVLVEPTSGNTGIALAMVGARRGYRVVLTMPESMSLERRKLLAAFGAELVLTPASLGMRGAVEKAEEIAGSMDEGFIPGQFDNPANPQVHYDTTGPEILRAVGETTAVLVAGVGTGGTISGTGRYLKEKDPTVQVVAVEPTESPVITQTVNGQPVQPGSHFIQGIGAGFVPKVLDLDILDEVLTVSSDDAITTARRLAREEGLLVGISSGANVFAALAIASRPEMNGKTVVTFAPSTGERYLSSVLWEGVV